MLGEILKEGLSDKQKVVEYLTTNIPEGIRRITYFDADGYGSGINIYLMSKKFFDNPTLAFVSGWLSHLLWIEESEEVYNYSKNSATAIFDEFFTEEIEKYVYSSSDEQSLKQYIMKRLQPIIISTLKKKKTSSAVEFLTESGVYVDKAYSEVQPILFKKNENYIDGVVMYEEDSAHSDYKEIFIETDKKYLLFFDM